MSHIRAHAPIANMDEGLSSLLRLSGWLVSARLAHDRFASLSYLISLETLVGEMKNYYLRHCSPDEAEILLRAAGGQEVEMEMEEEES